MQQKSKPCQQVQSKGNRIPPNAKTNNLHPSYSIGLYFFALTCKLNSLSQLAEVTYVRDVAPGHEQCQIGHRYV